MDSPRCTDPSCPSCGRVSDVEPTDQPDVWYCGSCNCCWVAGPEADEPRHRRDLE